MVKTRRKGSAFKARKRDQLSIPKTPNPSATPTHFVSRSASIIGGAATAKTVYLIDWWLINVGGGKELGIGGINSMQTSQLVRFTSAAISKRHSETIVETEDGFVIGISSLLNRENTLQHGFSFQVCAKFMHGFPYNWEEYRQWDHKSCGLDPDDDLLLSTLSYDLTKHYFQGSKTSEARNVAGNEENCKTPERLVNRGTPEIRPRVVTRSMSRMKLRSSS